MKKNKLIVFLLAICCLVLTACGDQSSAKEEEQSVTVSETPTQTPTTTPTVTPQKTETPATRKPIKTPAPTVKPVSSNKCIVIDAGHQAKGNSSLEPIGPGSTKKKAKVAGGATGVATGQKEYQLNLSVSK